MKCEWCKEELPDDDEDSIFVRFWHYYGHFNEEYYFKKWSKEGINAKKET